MTFYRNSLLAAALLAGFTGSSLPVAAADADAPAKALMDMVSRNWDENQDDFVDYFDEKHLGSLYSKAFVADYRAAQKFPAYDDPSSGPFDYDVMTDSQDGCPLTDLGYRTTDGADGVTDVVVSYKFFTCWVNDALVRDKVSELRIRVIEEGGKPVIDDILRQREDGDGSLRTEMQAIAKGP